MAQSDFKVGQKARVKSTGIEVIISQISSHGFAVVQYDCGYERMVLINQLQPYAHKPAALRAIRAA